MSIQYQSFTKKSILAGTGARGVDVGNERAPCVAGLACADDQPACEEWLSGGRLLVDRQRTGDHAVVNEVFGAGMSDAEEEVLGIDDLAATAGVAEGHHLLARCRRTACALALPACQGDACQWLWRLFDFQPPLGPPMFGRQFGHHACTDSAAVKADDEPRLAVWKLLGVELARRQIARPRLASVEIFEDEIVAEQFERFSSAMVADRGRSRPLACSPHHHGELMIGNCRFVVSNGETDHPGGGRGRVGWKQAHRPGEKNRENECPPPAA